MIAPPKPAPPPPKFPGTIRHTPEIDRPRREWWEILEDAGYPTDVVVIDFESYFDDEISMRGSKLSTVEYIMHPDYETLGVSVLTMTKLAPDKDHEQGTHWYNGEEATEQVIEDLQRVYGPNLAGCTVVAQNARFDLSILAYRHGIHAPYIIDVLGLARHWDSRSRNDLGSLAKRFKLPAEKGDTSKFKGWTNRTRYFTPRGRKKKNRMPERRPLITPSMAEELGRYANNDTAREWECFTHLLPLMSNPETELRIMQHTLDLFLYPVFRVDEEKAEELKSAMLAEIKKAVEPTGLSESDIRGGAWDEAMADALWHWADTERTHGPGDLPPPDQYTARFKKPAKNCKRGWKIASAKDDPEREQLETHADETVRGLMAAKAAVDSWPNHISRIERIVRQSRAAGGYLPVPLKYCGAHTGRWSGGEKINLQNLGSRGHELVNAIRELLVAPEGYELVIADASQIEARVLAWIAGQDDLIEKFANDEEIYCRFAEKVLDRPAGSLRKPKKDDPALLAGFFKHARNNIGKVGVLGCGYGMGDSKAVGYAKGAIDILTAKKLVKVYREDNDKIVQFWKDLERCFLYTFRYKRPCSMPRGLRFESRPDCDVVIILPNGRELKYHKVRMSEGRYGPALSVYNALEHKWAHVWGGHFAENVVQAMSRDILWEAMDRLERTEEFKQHRCGPQIIKLHVHDEAVAVVKQGQGSAVLERLVQYLRIRPDWAPDCPLDGEGVVTDRYGGH